MIDDKTIEAEGESVRVEARKLGRPCNAIRLMKERKRRQSTGSLTELWKRKRDSAEDVGERERMSDREVTRTQRNTWYLRRRGKYTDRRW